MLPTVLLVLVTHLGIGLAAYCGDGEKPYFEKCIKKSQFFTDFEFSASENMFHVRSDVAYNGLLGKSTRYVAHSKMVADALVANYGDNWDVMLISPYENVMPSYSGTAQHYSAGTPYTRLKGFVRMGGNYWSSGPFLHEIAHLWGVRAGVNQPDSDCSSHWGWSGLDVWGQLGGFTQSHIYCQNPRGRKPSKFSKCNDNKLIFIDESSGEAGGSPTSHYDGYPKSPIPFAKFELLMMGLLSPNDPDVRNESWMMCKAPCKPNERVEVKKDFSPSSAGISGFQKKNSSAKLMAFYIDCEEVKWITPQQFVDNIPDQIKKKQFKAGKNINMAFVLVYPGAIPLPQFPNPVWQGKGQAANNYADKMEQLFNEATYGKSTGRFSTKTSHGVKQNITYDCKSTAECSGNSVCNMIYGDLGICQQKLNISNLGRFCMSGTGGPTKWGLQDQYEPGTELSWIFNTEFQAAGTWNDAVWFETANMNPKNDNYARFRRRAEDNVWVGLTYGFQQIWCANGSENIFNCKWNKNTMKSQWGSSYVWDAIGEAMPNAKFQAGACGSPTSVTLPTFSSPSSRGVGKTPQIQPEILAPRTNLSFTKKSGFNCGEGGMYGPFYDNFQKAKDMCAIDDSCGGIQDIGCDAGNFVLCNSSMNPRESTKGTCLYMKPPPAKKPWTLPSNFEKHTGACGYSMAMKNDHTGRAYIFNNMGPAIQKCQELQKCRGLWDKDCGDEDVIYLCDYAQPSYLKSGLDKEWNRASCTYVKTEHLDLGPSPTWPPFGRPDEGSTDTKPSAGKWGDWGEWGNCSKTCAGGMKSRMRACMGGTCSSGSASETMSCGSGPCTQGGSTATCTDGIRNQGETKVDCGGPCAACETSPGGNEQPVTPGTDSSYTKVPNKFCQWPASGATYGGRYGSAYKKLDDAWAACVADTKCHGVQHAMCKGTNYQLCSWREEDMEYSSSSCMYIKRGGGSGTKSVDPPVVKPEEPKATCTDGIRNQGELKVDCGGPCAACGKEEQHISNTKGEPNFPMNDKDYPYIGKGFCREAGKLQANTFGAEDECVPVDEIEAFAKCKNHCDADYTCKGIAIAVFGKGLELNQKECKASGMSRCVMYTDMAGDKTVNASSLSDQEYRCFRRADMSSGGDKPVVTPEEPKATCTDGIKNQDEEKTDCGGTCAACPTEPVTPPTPSEIQAQMDRFCEHLGSDDEIDVIGQDHEDCDTVKYARREGTKHRCFEEQDMNEMGLYCVDAQGELEMCGKGTGTFCTRTVELTRVMGGEDYVETTAELYTGELNARYCYWKGEDMASRDASCVGELVCARKGSDDRDFGGCSEDGVAGPPFDHHCCSAVPKASKTQAQMNLFCEHLGDDDEFDVIGTDHEDCNAMKYARVDGLKYRCFEERDTNAMGLYCVDDLVELVMCFKGAGRFCTRTVELTRVMGGEDHLDSTAQSGPSAGDCGDLINKKDCTTLGCRWMNKPKSGAKNCQTKKDDSNPTDEGDCGSDGKRKDSKKVCKAMDGCVWKKGSCIMDPKAKRKLVQKQKKVCKAVFKKNKKSVDLCSNTAKCKPVIDKKNYKYKKCVPDM